MEVQKFELKDPADLFLMLANVMANAASKPKEEAEEEPQQPEPKCAAAAAKNSLLKSAKFSASADFSSAEASLGFAMQSQ